MARATEAAPRGGRPAPRGGLSLDVHDSLVVSRHAPGRLIAVTSDGEATDLVYDPDDTILRAPSNVACWLGCAELVVANLFGSHVSHLEVPRRGRDAVQPGGGLTTEVARRHWHPVCRS